MASTVAANFRRLLTLSKPSHCRTTREMATTATAAAGEVKTKAAALGDMVVLYVPLGLVLLGLTMGAYTAERQLASSPSVRVNKKRRGTVPEVDEPEHVAGEAERFVNRSFFRRIAHVQDFDATRSGISDPTRPENVFRRVETLKSVGVSSRSA